MQSGGSVSAKDELIYIAIAEVLAANLLKQGLWTKALADNNWDEGKAKAHYVRMRFAQIEQELDPKTVARGLALEAGLSVAEVNHLDYPIMAIRYVERYKVSKDRLAKACANGAIKHVMNDGVLWVCDRPL